jgi:hypothetical protein
LKVEIYTKKNYTSSWACSAATDNEAATEPLHQVWLRMQCIASDMVAMIEGVDLKSAAHWASAAPENFPHLKRTLEFEDARALKRAKLSATDRPL